MPILSPKSTLGGLIPSLLMGSTTAVLMWYNKKCIWSLSPVPAGVPKTQDTSVLTGVCFVIHKDHTEFMLSLRMDPESFKRGAGHTERPGSWIEGGNSQHYLHPQHRREGWRKLNHQSRMTDPLCLHTGTSAETETRLGGFRVGERIDVLRAGMPRGDAEAGCPHSILPFIMEV